MHDVLHCLPRQRLSGARKGRTQLLLANVVQEVLIFSVAVFKRWVALTIVGNVFLCLC